MKRYGAGIHHIAFEVDDVEGAFQYVRANGVRILGLGPVSWIAAVVLIIFPYTSI